MKILKLPFEKKFTCECGCEFEFEYEDLEVEERFYSFGNRKITMRNFFVECPFCKNKILINRRERQYDTDNTAGRK